MSSKKVTKRVSLILVALVALCVFVIVMSTYGGLSGYIKSIKKIEDPTGAKVTSARVEAQSTINDNFSNLSSQIQQFTPLTLEGTHDECGKGSHDWKRNDPFTEQCELSVTRFYIFGGDFSSQINGLAKSVKDSGWTANPNDTLEGLIKDYYDEYRTKGTDVYNDYTANNLPYVDGYTKDDFIMRFGFVDTKDPDLALQVESSRLKDLQTNGHTSIAVYNQFWQENNAVEDKDIYASGTSDKQYVLLVLISNKYFEK